MKDLLDRLDSWDIILLVICLGTALTGVITTVRAPHEYTACQQMAHGNIQAYNECVRAENSAR